jgi:hypothetical protein
MKLDEIWVLHHSHTDIGFTLDQPILWEMQRRFIDAAIDAAEEYADDSGPHAFKWVVETMAPLLYWLDHSSDRQIERFQALEKAGRIEVGGAFLNAVPLVDTADYAEMLQPIARLRRDYGFLITHVQNADVNGHNWPLVDVLRAAGIESFSMAINVHYGGAPFERPGLFHWQGPSGQSIPVLNNLRYIAADYAGIPWGPHKLEEQVPVLERLLTEVGWPLPFVLLQGTAFGGDNGTAELEYCNFIRKWNASRGGRPRLRMVTWREFWDAAAPALANAPLHAGDWTDFWNFGTLSSAKETAVARRARSRLRTADLLHAGLHGLGVGADDDTSGADYPARDPRTLLATTPGYRQEAWRDLETWHEHTWGSCAACDVDTEHASSLWHHKAHLAWNAHSLSLLLAQDGAAELGIRSTRRDDDVVVLYNPLPWDRTVAGDIIPKSCCYDMTRRVNLRRKNDPSSSRLDQSADYGPTYRLHPVAVPACGYTMVPEEKLQMAPVTAATEQESGETMIEDSLRRVVFDAETGGIVSWFDKQLACELIDTQSPWRWGSVIHEEVDRCAQGDPRAQFYGPISGGVLEKATWNPEWKATRRSHSRLLKHTVRAWPDATDVEQVVEVPGLASPVTLTFTFPRHENTLELRGSWTMGFDTWPESTYVAMPFAIPDAVVHCDVGGVGIEPGRQQLEGTCRDYFHLQNWADLSGPGLGVTIATPENPLAQFGDFHFAHYQKEFALERATFLGWITSNYWSTNFPGHQPGRVTARYHIRPHDGYEESSAHRFGMEAAMPCVVQNAREASRPETPLPRSGSLLKLPDLPVLTQQVLPAGWAGAGESGILLRLVNASDQPQAADVGSGILHIAKAFACDLFGEEQETLLVDNGTARVELAPRQQMTIRLIVGSP